MSAWTKGLDTAPTTGMVLVRLDEWDCPAVMRHETVDGEHGWAFVEMLLSDTTGWIEPSEAARAEWALLPQ